MAAERTDGAAADAVLYLVSRFPKVTETFVTSEALRVASRRRVYIAPLLRVRGRVVQPEARELLPVVRVPRVLSPRTLLDHLRLFATRRRTYVEAFRTTFAARPSAAALFVFWKAGRIAGLVRRLGVTHVHAHFVNHPATAAWLVHRLTGVPFSFTAHANDLFTEPVLLERKLADATVAVAISDYNRGLLRAVRPDANIEVVHCGIDPDVFRPSAHPRDPARVLCIAGFRPTKGHRVLLEAFATARERVPALRLELVGDGPRRRDAEALARRLGIAGAVEFHGWRDSTAVRELLEGAGCVVLASMPDPTGRMDGIPVSLMEAMACGLPVVSTELSGIPELVMDGRTGLLVPPGQPGPLADALVRLATDDDLATTLGAEARLHVERHFDARVEVQRLCDLFDGAAAGAGERAIG